MYLLLKIEIVQTVNAEAIKAIEDRKFSLDR